MNPCPHVLVQIQDHIKRTQLGITCIKKLDDMLKMIACLFNL